jgi:hypothetical protein
MSVNNYTDNPSSAVRDALRTTGATTVCPFHSDAAIRVGDDAAERARLLLMPERSSRPMARHGSGKILWKSSGANSAKPRTVVSSLRAFEGSQALKAWRAT